MSAEYSSRARRRNRTPMRWVSDRSPYTSGRSLSTRRCPNWSLPRSLSCSPRRARGCSPCMSDITGPLRLKRRHGKSRHCSSSPEPTLSETRCLPSAPCGECVSCTPNNARSNLTRSCRYGVRDPCKPYDPCDPCNLYDPCLSYRAKRNDLCEPYKCCSAYDPCKPLGCGPCKSIFSDPCNPPLYDPCTPNGCNPCKPLRCDPCKSILCNPCKPLPCDPCPSSRCDPCKPLQCVPCTPSRCDRFNPCRPTLCKPSLYDPCKPGLCKPSVCDPCSPQYKNAACYDCPPTPKRLMKPGKVTCDKFRSVCYPCDMPTKCQRPRSCSPCDVQYRKSNPSEQKDTKCAPKPCTICKWDPCTCSYTCKDRSEGTVSKLYSPRITCIPGPSREFKKATKDLGKYNCCRPHFCPWEADVTVSGTVRGHCTTTTVEVANRLTGRFRSNGKRYSVDNDSCRESPRGKDSQRVCFGKLDDGTVLDFSRNNLPTSVSVETPALSEDESDPEEIFLGSKRSAYHHNGKEQQLRSGSLCGSRGRDKHGESETGGETEDDCERRELSEPRSERIRSQPRRNTVVEVCSSGRTRTRSNSSDSGIYHETQLSAHSAPGASPSKLSSTFKGVSKHTAGESGSHWPRSDRDRGRETGREGRKYVSSSSADFLSGGENSLTNSIRLEVSPSTRTLRSYTPTNQECGEVDTSLDHIVFRPNRQEKSSCSSASVHCKEQNSTTSMERNGDRRPRLSEGSTCNYSKACTAQGSRGDTGRRKSKKVTYG